MSDPNRPPIDLLLGQPHVPTPGPVDLVFGDEGDGPQVIGRLRIVGQLTGARSRVVGQYRLNVQRPIGIQVAARMQATGPVSAPLLERQQQARPLRVQALDRTQAAQPVAAAVQVQQEQAQRLQCLSGDRGEQAVRLAAQVLHGMQQADRLRTLTLARAQQALRVRQAAGSDFQQMHRLRAWMQAHLQQARRTSTQQVHRFTDAVHRLTPLGVRLQQATRPAPGLRPRPQPPKPVPCYVPGLPAELLFIDEVAASRWADLLFCCCSDTPTPPGPQPQYVIPLLPVYMTVHHLAAWRLPGMEPLRLDNVTIAADDDQFGWSLSASGRAELMDLLAPESGLPARIKVQIDGIDWVFAITGTERSRRFGETRVGVTGVSVTALLAEPYLPAQAWLPTLDRTAQQLVLDALDFTGVALDWRITDWLVPGGVWSFQGAPLAVAQRVAEAAGAVVRSHRTAEQLIIAPRYPHLPWEWGDATPDVRMPAAVVTTDSLRPELRAEFNQVWVSGQQGGVLGNVRRRLTVGDVPAPEVVDSLITHSNAALQRGRTVLASSGNKLAHVLTMPVLTGGTHPGVLQPGQLLEVADTDTTWRGLVRGVSVSAALPKVRQQVTVERVMEAQP